MYLPKLLEENRVFAVLMGVTVVYLFWQVSLSAAILTAGTLEESQRLSRLAMLNPILTQEAWRQRMVATAQKTLAQEQAQRFQPAEHYAEGGVFAKEGKDFCIAVFLPPVALGFSVIVCFLHITNVAVVFFGHARLFPGLTAAVLAWPLLFGPSLPLAGLSGMYYLPQRLQGAIHPRQPQMLAGRVQHPRGTR